MTLDISIRIEIKSCQYATIFICFAYIPPSDSVYFKSYEVGYFEQIEIGVRKYSDMGKVSITGDLNSRTAERDDFITEVANLDKYIFTLDNSLYDEYCGNISKRYNEDKVCNSSGIKLLDLCKSSGLKIVNGRVGDDAGIGRCQVLVKV